MVKPFVPPGTPTHYTPDRPVAVAHVRLEIDLDLARRSLAGRATLHLTARRDGLTHVELHAVEMTIDAVTVDERQVAPSTWRYDGRVLRVPLGRAVTREQRLVVAVSYRCQPRRGLYFVGPDPTFPDRPLQCWTQGQDEDSRHYWPGVDAPIEKATSEVLCTAPRGLFVLSNGDLVERRDIDGARTRWHYSLGLPHAGYLITLVCGPFVELADHAPRTGVELRYHVPPGREDDARRTLGRTPAMIDFFSERIGVPYPHKRYSQIVVSDFIFGGMENTTATTLTDQALLDPRAALDHDMDALVAHELAHQWWGDLVTCREWPEAWLNEGFATYAEYLWREHARGRDEADVELLADTEAYLTEAGKYQRPIVCRQFDEPIELFDAHLYDKGGRVLHMLRADLGDDVFWRTLGHYTRKHAHGSVETRDLARAAEETSGRNFDRFFEQWVGTPGHLELEGRLSYDEERRTATLRLEQKQEADKVFSTLVRFEVGDEILDRRIDVRERVQSFDFALPDRPQQAIFDPGDVLLKTLKLEKATPLWLRQLEAAQLGVDRVLAARALEDRPEPKVVSALATALDEDPFWAVRAAAARALGRIRGDAARDALLTARGQREPKVRRAVASALGEWRGDDPVAAALATWADAGDPSLFVEGQAALALGRVRAPAALEVLPRLLARPSYQDTVRVRAIEGLAASGEETALPVLLGALRPAATFQVRRAAVTALARLCEGTPQARRAREAIEVALTDRDFRVRMDAALALAELGDARAVEKLERAAAHELDGRARRRMRRAISDLASGGRPAEQLRKLGDEVERLRGETQRLRERLDRL
jgi:aminopeptidase N